MNKSYLFLNKDNMIKVEIFPPLTKYINLNSFLHLFLYCQFSFLIRFSSTFP
jgi:hypothetical protein